MLMLRLLPTEAVLAQDATAELEAWSVDPLVKVFQDDAPVAGGEAMADVARGEHATFQVVVRSEKPLARLRCQVKPPVHETTRRALVEGTVRFVGYVPIDVPMRHPPNDRLRIPPAAVRRSCWQPSGARPSR